MRHTFDNRQRIGTTQGHPVFDLRAGRGDGLDQRGKGGVKQHHFVVGVVDDVSQLFGVQARVAGVHHHAAARHGVIRLQVAVVVPGNRPHHAARAQAQLLQCVGQLLCAACHVGKTVTVQRTLCFARNDVLLTKLAGPMFQNG